MLKNYGPISNKITKILHGADYNPDQWLHIDGILEEDVRLMKLANCNVMAINIFGWSSCEPSEGVFTFEWLDEVFDTLYKNGVYVILATPSGARPTWMSEKYPEVLRVNEIGLRNFHGERHNHCYTSEIYRDKVNIINTKLAQRYGNHPGLIMWHISNEYEGECHCDNCQNAFRNYLKEKYASLDVLNKAWWTGFWSHTYFDWSQIRSPSSIGEQKVHGLNLDWHRFRTHQTLDFYKHEIEPLKQITPDIPVTTNFHDFVSIGKGIDYWKFAPHVDVISWDNYPLWHGENEAAIEAGRRAFIHDINRSLKQGKPFMLMESSPSATNWQKVSKLRRPGMHNLASMQAVAHGSDTVQYFQWRKSLGSSEKFHGAVVDHFATTNTRVFREVTELGVTLEKLDRVLGTSVNCEVAIVYDWENSWAIHDSEGPRIEKREYFETVQNHYQAFWNLGISVDIIDMTCDISSYTLVVAPMLYMLKEGFSEKVDSFVKNGGNFATTYWSGIVGETDLCFTNGRPGPLKNIMGIWSEELDVLYDGQVNIIKTNWDNSELKKEYTAEIFCDLVHLEGAKSLAQYDSDFYKGFPAITENAYGKGKAYYIAFRSYDSFADDFYKTLASQIKLKRCIDTNLPRGVTAQMRYDECNTFIFIQNYNEVKQCIDLQQVKFTNTLTGELVSGEVELKPFSYIILEPK